MICTHRPRKVEWKSDGIGEARKCNVGVELNDVITENRGNNIAISARCRGVDLDLILFEANPESRFTDSGAGARTGCTAGATFAQTVLSVLVDERL